MNRALDKPKEQEFEIRMSNETACPNALIEGTSACVRRPDQT